MRRGLWFRTLNRLDRALVDLTLKVSSTIRSGMLAKGILLVMRKLQTQLESKVDRATREIGFPLTAKLGMFATSWGYKAALEWANDDGFARYWAVMKLNGYP